MLQSACIVCGSKTSLKTDCGDQPISNRYLKATSDEETLHSMQISQCSVCGLVQLSDPSPVSVLTPIYNWIRYSEPESHLDDLVKRLIALNGITERSAILGLTYQDDTTLERFSKKNIVNTYRLDNRNDLHIKSDCSGVETIQEYISKKKFSIPTEISSPSIVVGRYIFEHAHDPIAFLNGLKDICTESTYLVFEVPDCASVFKASDYSFLWEEHTLYFVEETLRQTFDLLNFSVIDILKYPEVDALVAIVKIRKDKDSMEIKSPQYFNSYFSTSLEDMSLRYRNILSHYKNRHVLFGAGHLGIKFINLHSLADLFEAVIDDNPDKKGMFMPGSKLPITGSEVLLEPGKFDLCVLTASSQSEIKIIEKYKSFSKNGGKFYSAIRSSDMALPI